ncbi:ATP-binding protein [Comamonadaceae bacterium M7527]|nr:ATP-binding protein [Comamonadaceae bacterium M7527]
MNAPNPSRPPHTDEQPTLLNASYPQGSWQQRLRRGDVDTVSQLFLLLSAANAAWFALVSVSTLGLLSNIAVTTVLLITAAARGQDWISRPLSVWILLAVGYIDITINIAAHGGIWSPVLTWYIVLPLPALFVLGVRAMAVMVALSVVTVSALGWAQSQHMLPDLVFSEGHTLWAVMVFTGLALSVSILPLLYHNMHNGLVTDLNAKNVELKRVRDDLLDEQMQKDDFLASVSHELRTPMNAIIGFLQAIERRPNEDAQTVEMLGYMDHSAKHLMTIINDLLDLSQMRAGKLKIEARKLDLHKQVHNISRSFKPQLDERGIDFQVDIKPQVHQWVMLDADRLSQVLINLLGNAAKFTSQGHVHMVVCATPHRTLRFEVRDTGRGIDKAHLERVFDRFSDITNRTRRAYGGTGLGLSICRQLVELQQGHIGVDSELGVGTTFWFELPLIECEPPSRNEQQHAYKSFASGETVGGHVLIVDDSLVNRLVAKQLLLNDLPDLKITEAGNAQTALEALGTGSVDLILMDVVMPDKDGIETTAEIRTTDLSTVIIGLTADVTPDVKSRCLNAGMNDVITKPFDRQALVYRVRQGLAGKAFTQG